MKLFYKALLPATCVILLAFCKPEISNPDKNKAVTNLFSFEGKNYKPGDTVYGYKNYVKLVVGDNAAPLLIGAPHDGTAVGSPEIPETGKTGRDINTLPLAFKIAECFKKSTKLRPWIMINTISRKRVDPNTYPDEVDSRYITEDGKLTYYSYHNLLSEARKFIAAEQKNGKGGLFFDLHGHAHKYVGSQAYISVDGKLLTSNFIDQAELGYGLNANTISTNEILNNAADSSSIAAIAKAHPQVPFSEIIKGQFSLGGLLEAEKVRAVPSPAIPALEANEELFGLNSNGQAKNRPYFNGGYCTRKYGTTVFGKTTGFNDNISSIQAEVPGITARNNTSIIEVSGQRYSNALVKFLNKWYGYTFKI